MCSFFVIQTITVVIVTRRKNRKSAHLGFVLYPHISRGGRVWGCIFPVGWCTRSCLCSSSPATPRPTEWSELRSYPSTDPLIRGSWPSHLQPCVPLLPGKGSLWLCFCGWDKERQNGLQVVLSWPRGSPLNSCLWTHLLDIKLNGFHQSSLDMTLGQGFISAAAVFSFPYFRSAHSFWPGSFKTQLTEGRDLNSLNY